MKKSIQLIFLPLISFFFLVAVESANAHILISLEQTISAEDSKKEKKKKNQIKTKVSERENPPVTEDYSTSNLNDETFNYMSSPKLEDCTKPDFDRE